QQVSGDALDIDFSAAELDHLQFEQCGGDALDLSGSAIKAADIVISEVVDKGISIGENCEVEAAEIAVSSAAVGIAVKDGSRLDLRSATFEDANIGLAVFNKKNGFGRVGLNAKNVRMTAVDRKWALARPHDLTVDSLNITPTFTDQQLRTILYPESVE
ncbi:MAG: hypothetical protein AAF840_15640, partial [Bacteroidota bacterium]